MIKICKNCNKKFETSRSSKQHCSTECFSEYRKRPEVANETKRKRAETNLKIYGVDNPSKSDVIKKRAKKTCLKKYGAISPTLNKTVRKKQIKTNIMKYGFENAFQNKDIQKKHHETLMKNYGVVIPLKNSSVVDKLKKTNILLYGVDNPAKTKHIKNKTKNTCLQRYGTKSPMQCDEIKNKMRITVFKGYYNNMLNGSKYNNIIPLFSENEYKGNISYSTKYKFKCNTCNTEFYDTIINGRIPRCTSCFPPKSFYMENELYDWIKSILNSTEIIKKNDRDTIKPLELDIYIPNKKLAIEFDGLYWHSELNGKDKKYHLKKTEMCLEKGIRLLHIFEDEWIDKKDIVKRRLQHILNEDVKNTSKIYARNCKILEINQKESSKFLNENHIQGADKSNIRFGAFYNNELVSVMTFGKLRLALGNKSKEDEYEMYRFCIGKKNVVGIGGKLLSNFLKKYNPIKIISYSDRRWNANASFYEKIGFNFIKKTSCNYWYIDKNYNHRYYRFNFRKNNLKNILESFDPSRSEWENMQLNGYDRIWDCGNLKYEYTQS